MEDEINVYTLSGQVQPESVLNYHKVNFSSLLSPTRLFLLPSLVCFNSKLYVEQLNNSWYLIWLIFVSEFILSFFILSYFILFY